MGAQHASAVPSWRLTPPAKTCCSKVTRKGNYQLTQTVSNLPWLFCPWEHRLPMSPATVPSPLRRDGVGHRVGALSPSCASPPSPQAAHSLGCPTPGRPPRHLQGAEHGQGSVRDRQSCLLPQGCRAICLICPSLGLERATLGPASLYLPLGHSHPRPPRATAQALPPVLCFRVANGWAQQKAVGGLRSSSTCLPEPAPGCWVTRETADDIAGEAGKLCPRCSGCHRRCQGNGGRHPAGEGGCRSRGPGDAPRLRLPSPSAKGSLPCAGRARTLGLPTGSAPTLPPPRGSGGGFPLGDIATPPGAALLGWWQQGEGSRCAPAPCECFAACYPPRRCLLALPP